MKKIAQPTTTTTTATVKPTTRVKKVITGSGTVSGGSTAKGTVAAGSNLKLKGRSADSVGVGVGVRVGVPHVRHPLRHPSNDPSVRAFVQANARVSNMTALFHDEMDSQNLSAALVKNARKSGVLNLSGRNLNNVPMKVWRMNELDENERSTVSVSLDDPSDEKWWEFVDLQKLIIANNYITDIPCDVCNLTSLQTFDAHDNQILTISKDLGKLNNLTKLDLSHNKLKLVPEELGELKRLTEMKLSHNALEDIPSGFGNLSCLRSMDISHNNLSNIPGDLGFLSFLTSLNLSNNKLTELPEDIGGLTGLRTLDVSENRLISCPASFVELVHLEMLYLQRNKLEVIPDVSRAKNLKELYLQNNIIKEVSSESLAMTKVHLLDLRTNKIENLEINCDDFEFLERLYLDNNELSQLPNELALLPSLKALTLDGNPIRGIRLDILQRGTLEILKYLKGKLRLSESSDGGDGFGQSSASNSFLSPSGKPPNRRRSGHNGSTSEELGIDPYKAKSSRSLNLSSKQIAELDIGVLQLAADNGVTCIDLSKNQMNFLPPSIDICCEWLAELKLDFNRLTELPSSICKCTRLQYLSLQNNQLNQLPDGFTSLKSLREINLGYNKFVLLPMCLYDIPSLEIINLASNKIDKLEPENLEKLTRLAVLDVRNNNIGQMPPEIGLLTQLRSLSIEGNAFRVPNYQIISQGTDSILAYLRNRIAIK